MSPDITPSPKKCTLTGGEINVKSDASGLKVRVKPMDDEAEKARGVVSEFLGCARSGTGDQETTLLTLQTESPGFAGNVSEELLQEAYRLSVSESGILISAAGEEGLLRGAATLGQLLARKNSGATVPLVEIADWPNFRYRCAADLLMNVECNRWALDRGDGREAYLARVKKKLDFCFEHKINMVWFDGFGWDTGRFPGYARLMKECNRYARRLKIKLLFNGYGGGYGAAYQKGEIYRYGYFGKSYVNRRPYPDGGKYRCRGWKGESRFHGTCLTNDGLAEDKIAEMKRFVSEINPGFMYIHDIDAGTWISTSETWKNRCEACRSRWPSDEIASEQGQAGAFASWYSRVRHELSSLPDCGDYSPAEDLEIIFISPGYTSYMETEPAGVWDLEMEYFLSMSWLIGPVRGVEFGLREQFLDAGGKKRIKDLKDKLDSTGHGHGIHIISFGGGDNYISDDLANISGSIAHLFEGAESVCLSNGGLHQEPVQALNADFLWSGHAGGFAETPADNREAKMLYEKIAEGKHRPPAMFSSGGVFEKTCGKIYGREAGRFMNAALNTRADGITPVSHVWWSITKTVEALKNEAPFSLANCLRVWKNRRLATIEALGSATKASSLSSDKDIQWFVSCLETGRRFAEAVELLFEINAQAPDSKNRFKKVMEVLDEHMAREALTIRTDILGGDPGCREETAGKIKSLGEHFLKNAGKRPAVGDFIMEWLISPPVPAPGAPENLEHPRQKEGFDLKKKVFFTGYSPFCQLYPDRPEHKDTEAVVYCFNRFCCEEKALLEVRFGYDGPAALWIDGKKVYSDAHGKNPGEADSAIIPWEAGSGEHEIAVALASNRGRARGIFFRFAENPAPGKIESGRTVNLPKIAGSAG